MTDTHDYTWDEESRLEPVGTVPIVGDELGYYWPHSGRLDRHGNFVTTIPVVGKDGLWSCEATGLPFGARPREAGGGWRILKRKKTPEKPSENKENPQKMDEKVHILDENDLFSLAADRIEIRSDGYGPEQSFGHIARRWNVMMENRGSDFRFSACDVALFMLDFKLGRRESRASSGKAKRDDFTDACGYLWWADKLVEEE